GIHVHGIIADTSTYEPISPELVGRERKIVIGKHAGKASIMLALKEMGIEPTEEQLNEIITRVKELGDKGKKVTDADLEAIAETVLNISKEPNVKLLELTVVSGTITPTASIRLQVNGKEKTSSGIGTGPVDAAINALRNALSEIGDVELEEYHVDAITGGTDALVEVVVRMRKGDNVITAKGARSDIIMASVEAVIEGINRLLSRLDKS
ncbi:2-isopropylmalate synthase, partial [Methanosarcinales archaeon]